MSTQASAENARSIWKQTQDPRTYARFHSDRKEKGYEEEFEVHTKRFVVGIIKADQDDDAVYDVVYAQ